MRTGSRRVLRQGGSVASRLSLMHAMNFLGVGFYLPFFPVWLAYKGLDDVAIGAILTVPIIMRVVAASWVTGLGDHRIAPVLLLSLLNGLAALFYLALAPAEGAWLIGLILALNAVAISGVIPLGDMLTTAQVRAGAPVDYGRVRVWGSISCLLMHLLGGWLLARHGAGIVPVALAASAGLASLAALAAPPPPGQPHRSAALDDAGQARFSAPFWLAVAGIACVNATHAPLYGFGSLHWRQLGFSDSLIGMFWALGVAAEIGLFLVAGGVVARGIAGFAWIAVGALATIVRFGAMAFVTGPWASLALQMMHALTFACVHLGAMALVSALAPEGRRAAAQGRLVASGALASAAMTLLSGFLFQRYAALSFLAAIPLSLAGLGLLLLAKRRLAGDTGSEGAESGEPGREGPDAAAKGLA